MKYTFISDKGISRTNNEDFILISEDLSLFLLADGMGGHEGGEIASEEACRYIMQVIYDQRNKLKKNPKEIIQTAIEEANLHLLDMAKENPKLEGMGTTLVLLYLNDSKYTLCHIGDSRAYKYDGESLIKLTKDHSLVQKMIDDKVISEEEAKTHKYRNVITRSLGSPLEGKLEFLEGSLNDGELILMCTDGLHDYVDLEEVKNLIEEDGVDAINHIVHLANQAGGKDNCSVICISK